MEEETILPTEDQIVFLKYAYNRFYDIFEETFSEVFWQKEPYIRFGIIKDAFSIYSELIEYEPLKYAIDYIKRNRPPMEGEIADQLFKCIRNIIIHFPIYTSWDEVWINRNLVKWNNESRSIDKFFSKYSGHECVKYRFWIEKTKTMTYLSINFPNGYLQNTKLLLKDILNEKNGFMFSLVLMKKVLDTQVEKIED
jgi:hypothetical protein